MRRALILLAILGLAAAPAFAQVTIDYAHDFDFKAVKTFQYVEDEESASVDPIMAGRIASMIKQKLVDGGLEEVTENPDLYVTFHVATQDRQVINTTSFGYGGYGPGWYGWGGAVGVGSTTSTVSTYTDGTLVIDAWGPTDKKLVWRGMGTVTLKAQPEARVKQVEKILAKLGSRWKKILKNQGK